MQLFFDAGRVATKNTRATFGAAPVEKLWKLMKIPVRSAVPKHTRRWILPGMFVGSGH